MSRFFISDVRVDTIDLLEEWYKDAWARSSEFAPRGYKLYDRGVVEGNHQTLRQFFPAAYFIHSFGTDQSLQSIGIVKRLLMSPLNRISFVALDEICALLTYAITKQPALAKNLRLQAKAANARQFQASLYEAFIARQCSGLGLDYACDVKVAGKRRDGTFAYKGGEWIVECKQQFAPRVDEFDIMRRAVDQVLLQLRRIGVEGGGGLVIRVKRPAQESAVMAVHRLFSEVIAVFSKPMTTDATAPSFIDASARIDFLPLGFLDPGARTTDEEFIARIEINPEGQTPSISATAPISIGIDFGYTREKVLQKLEGIILDAQEQHKDRGNRRLMICVDSQELPDLEFGLLQGSDMLAEEASQRRVKAAVNDAMVVITQRRYTEKSAKQHVRVVYPTRDEALAKLMMQKQA